MVTMSRVYEVIRGDVKVEEKTDEKQDFVRSTRKYWVHTEDVSRVKYVILVIIWQHLSPLFFPHLLSILFLIIVLQYLPISFLWSIVTYLIIPRYVLLQHLPVFLQKTMAGETDSQLVNSVYLDNLSMELYNGRLDKTPGAIALRHRWYIHHPHTYQYQYQHTTTPPS